MTEKPWMRKEPTHKPGVETVDLLVEAARKLLLQGDLSAITIEMLAKASKVPDASIYQYFYNKLGVFMEMVYRDREIFIEALSKSGVSPETATAMVDNQPLATANFVYGLMRQGL